MWLRDELAALDPQRPDLRRFGFVFGGAILALAALAWFKGSPALPYLLGAGGLSVLLGAVVPASLRAVYYGWMTVGLVLGKIVTAIILTLVFLLAVTPVGFVMRLVGRDPMQRRLDRQADTYWIPKRHTIPDKSRYEKYF